MPVLPDNAGIVGRDVRRGQIYVYFYVVPYRAGVLAVEMYVEDVATFHRLNEAKRQTDERVLVPDEESIVGEDDHTLGRVVEITHALAINQGEGQLSVVPDGVWPRVELTRMDMLQALCLPIGGTLQQRYVTGILH